MEPVVSGIASCTSNPSPPFFSARPPSFVTLPVSPWWAFVRAQLVPAAALGVAALALGLVGPRAATAQSADSTQLRRFQRANVLLQSEKYEQAIPLLERLYQQSPTNTAFYRKLKDAYESVKRYDDAIRLVDERMDGTPTVPLLSTKARLQYLQGAVQTANGTWDRALRLDPQNRQTYQTVYRTLADLRHFQKAIAVLQQGRSTLERPDAFRTELAYLYGLDGQFRKSMREYVDLLANAPQRLNYVRSRLRTFVEQGQGIAASIEVLKETVRESPLNSAYRKLLAWLHMEQNDYDAAFDVYRAIDRLDSKQGTVLYRFAQRAADAQKYAVATRACETILERSPDSPVAADVQKSLGDLYRQWAEWDDNSASPAQDSARYDRARDAYEAFLQSYPGHEDYPTALLELGTLQLDAYHALGEAAGTLEQVVTNHSETTAADRAQYHLGRIALIEGRLTRARLLFSRLATSAQGSDLADRARFELALLHFYKGEFEAAMARARATSKNPASDVANDAIELKTLIQENQGPDSLNTALRTFAHARLQTRQRAHEEALATLDTLQHTHPQHPLADNAQFQRGHIHVARRDTAAALSAFRALSEQHPRSPHADRGLFRAGQLLEAQGRPAAALEVYNQLLTEYPQSLLAGKVRSRLRALQQRRG